MSMDNKNYKPVCQFIPRAFPYVCIECGKGEEKDLVTLQKEVYMCKHHLSLDQYNQVRLFINKISKPSITERNDFVLGYRNDFVLGYGLELMVYEIKVCRSCAVVRAGSEIEVEEINGG